MSALQAMMAAGGMKAFGSVLQGEMSAQADEYNAAVANQNALITQQQGTAAVQALQRDQARKIGSMVAAYGASGVQSDSGSPMDVLADSVRMATLDQATLQYNYQLKALGYSQQAALDGYKASADRTSGVLNAFGAGLETYGNYKKTAGTGTPIPNFGQ